MSRARRAHLQAASTTHPGMKGKNNEDRLGVFAFHLDQDPPLPSTLAIVCDGIGGHRAGEVAAEIAVETINRILNESNGKQPLETLKEAIVLASEAIRQQAEANPAQRGMGATCACAWIIGDRLYTVTVGDSRIYLVRSGAISQLSTDHTWIQEALEFGALTPEQARGHPNAHVIRRYLGSQQPPEADFRLRLNPGDSDDQARANQGLRLQAGDKLLLCSDGLTDLVEDPEIQAALENNALQESLERLQTMANQRGGHDNITIVALEAPARGFAPQASPSPALEETMPTVVTPKAAEKPSRQPWPWVGTCIGAAIVLGVLGVFFGGLTWAVMRETPTPTVDATRIQITFPSPTSDASPTTTPTPSPTAGATDEPLFPILTATTQAPLIFPSTPTPTPWPNTLNPQPLSGTRTPTATSALTQP